MKRLIILGLVMMAFVACQQHEKRYFGESAEIETLKAGIAAYEAGEWDKWRSHFSDTAKIYVNSNKSMSVEARVEELQGMTTAFSSYGFDHDEDKEHIEMVFDKEDETWVYYWATHNGTMTNGKKLSIPVHIAVHFVDGKITAEHVYFDGTEMNKELEAMMAAQAAAEATPVE